MKTITRSVFALALGLSILSCSDDDGSSSATVTKAAVIENYANIVFANYQKSYDDAVILEQAINAFTANPTDANFTTAKNRWKDARESYGTTEAFRFANGPIDDEDGPEGLLNAWPLDENYIDYVAAADGTIINGGIINNTVAFPSITKELLEELNEKDGEKNISIGYHAIEFLLWGQDLDDEALKTPGKRPYTDFVVGTGGTALNQARRAEYLKICADLLTDHLQLLIDEWKVGGTYRTTFLALPENTALKNMYLGITTLVAAELAVERMEVALGNADQEDEHSCFSDNTHRDIALNLQGVINVYEGEYGSIDGPSLEDLVEAANKNVANQTDTAINDTQASVAAILTPFDLAIVGGPDSAEGAKVKTAVAKLKNLGANLLAGAQSLGITFVIGG